MADVKYPDGQFVRDGDGGKLLRSDDGRLVRASPPATVWVEHDGVWTLDPLSYPQYTYDIPARETDGVMLRALAWNGTDRWHGSKTVESNKYVDPYYIDAVFSWTIFAPLGESDSIVLATRMRVLYKDESWHDWGTEFVMTRDRRRTRDKAVAYWNQYGSYAADTGSGGTVTGITVYNLRWTESDLYPPAL